jgi:diguanylate cyclase (GGDEF)-like protein
VGSRRAAGRLLVAGRLLGILTWVLLPVGVGTVLLMTRKDDGVVKDTTPVVLMAIWFALVLARLVVTAVADSRRRRSLIVLAASIALWAAASAGLNAGGADSTEFPAPGEWLFLLSYLGMAAFLMLDGGRGRGRGRLQLTTWLDAAVVCGGTACLAGAVLLTPVALGFGQTGLPLLTALLYPLIDIVLALLVVGQVVLRLRRLSWRTWALIGGFLAFAVADSSFVANLSVGTYQFGSLLYLAWGLGFVLVASAACLPREEVLAGPPRRQRPRVLLGAASVALAVLVARPSRAFDWYLTLPAVLTLVAAGGRLVLALREARGAAEAYRLARTDDLTELPNRRAVLARLDEGLAEGEPLALMLLDLDGFKEINDTLGHAAGDAVLEQAAARMCRSFDDDVLIARLGGDEFALVLDDDDPIRLLETAQQVREVLLAPTRIDGLELAMNASVGITVREDGDAKSTDLLRRADVAMYQAKVTRAGALLYDPSRDDFSRQRLRLAEDLRRGIADGQLVVWYQPQVDARTGEVLGVEALVRWSHPRQGLLPPALFLPGARRSGLMLALSEAVMGLVLQDARQWSAHGMQMRVAMNFAPTELLGGILLPRLFEAVDASGLPGESVVVEVTEESFLADPARARSVLEEIRRHGVQIAIDDYGTGFSSLSYLRDLPVQELKMDRSFVSTVIGDERSRMIVASTNQMARALGLRMVAEGVEDEATSLELRSMGVDVLQGYHVARPMPPAQVEGWVERWRLQQTQLIVHRDDLAR